MPTIPEIFKRILPILQNKNFLDRSLAKPEVPFYICPYDASKQAEMDDMVKLLVSQLASNGVSVLAINLFNLLLDCMKKNDDLEWELEHEQEVNCTFLRTLLLLLYYHNHLYKKLQVLYLYYL